MTFITFIYKIGVNKKIYYGKYTCDYISDDHGGLDNEIKPILVNGLNQFRKKNDLVKMIKKVYIGIMCFSNDRYIPTYSSDSEIKCFDFYCKINKNKKEIYVNGKFIE